MMSDLLPNEKHSFKTELKHFLSSQSLVLSSPGWRYPFFEYEKVRNKERAGGKRQRKGGGEEELGH